MGRGGAGAEGRRAGGAQDEDFDFGELRKAHTREQQPAGQSSSFARGKHPGDEEDLDFSAVRSKSRPTFNAQAAGSAS